jgi:hypothetical protein
MKRSGSRRDIAFVLGIAAMLCFTTAIADDSCRRLEYAEIKDMPSEVLLKTYCRYGKLARIDQATRKQLSDLYTTSVERAPDLARRVDTGKLDDYSRSIENCFDQMAKIGTALKARDQPAPACDP